MVQFSDKSAVTVVTFTVLQYRTITVSSYYPGSTYLFKVNNRNTKKICKICSKFAIKTPERSGVFIVNFEHISHLGLVFLLLTFNV